MPPFATDFASGRLAPLTFDRLANPDGRAPELAGDALHLTVQHGAYDGPVRPGWESSARCEMREPGKIPLGIQVHHSFVLRLGAGFPVSPLRMVIAQLKLNGGDSPLFALRVHEGRLFADWRLPGFSVEHFNRLPRCARDWTRFDLISGADGAELLVDGDRISRIRMRMDPALTRYLKIGPYRDADPRWGDAPAVVEVRSVGREVLSSPEGVRPAA